MIKIKNEVVEVTFSNNQFLFAYALETAINVEGVRTIHVVNSSDEVLSQWDVDLIREVVELPEGAPKRVLPYILKRGIWKTKEHRYASLLYRPLTLHDCGSIRVIAYAPTLEAIVAELERIKPRYDTETLMALNEFNSQITIFAYRGKNESADVFYAAFTESGGYWKINSDHFYYARIKTLWAYRFSFHIHTPTGIQEGWLMDKPNDRTKQTLKEVGLAGLFEDLEG